MSIDYQTKKDGQALADQMQEEYHLENEVIEAQVLEVNEDTGEVEGGDLNV